MEEIPADLILKSGNEDGALFHLDYGEKWARCKVGLHSSAIWHLIGPRKGHGELAPRRGLSRDAMTCQGCQSISSNCDHPGRSAPKKWKTVNLADLVTLDAVLLVAVALLATVNLVLLAFWRNSNKTSIIIFFYNRLMDYWNNLQIVHK